MNKVSHKRCGIINAAIGVLLASIAFPAVPASASQTFNVKHFGATGNGVTDDTSAILAALAAANAVPGSTVVFPPGNYLYSSDLVANGISINGRSAALTAISPSTSLELTGNAVSVQGMTFASRAKGTTGVFVFNARRFSVTNDTFNTELAVSVQIAQSSNGSIQSNEIGVGANSAGVVLASSQSVSIANNAATGNGLSTIFLQMSNSSNVSVSANRVSGVESISNESDNSTVAFQRNVFSGFGGTGIGLNRDQNVTISGNQFTGTSQTVGTVVLAEVQNSLVSNNVMQQGGIAILSGGSRNLQISGNTISDAQFGAIQTGFDNTVIIKNNTIRRANIGVAATSNTNMSILGNQITQIQGTGILGVNCLGTETISDNEIRSCGLSTAKTTAVIFVDSPAATRIPIIHNSYTGNTTNLQFFIRCVQASPPAQVAGNATNTGLPTLVGP